MSWDTKNSRSNPRNKNIPNIKDESRGLCGSLKVYGTSEHGIPP